MKSPASHLTLEGYPHASDLDMYGLMERLLPICRSITGHGVRQTLDVISEYVRLDRHEIPSGTQVFDWVVPLEWNIREAWIKDSKGNVLVDFAVNNLHVVSYSRPVSGYYSLEQLRPHLFSLPDMPSLVPYRTSYYEDDWGFCVSHDVLSGMGEDLYEVLIDADLQPGSLTFGQCLIPGQSAEEVLFSTHICHPSMCNDNLSGIVVSAALAHALKQRQNRYSYRFLFVPGTIGAITWLALNEKSLVDIKYGLVLSLLSRPGPFTYKRSRQHSSGTDQIVELALEHHGSEFEVRDFSPYGYDERQYCSPGINLPVGSLTRSPYNEFPEYHTSADNMNTVSSGALQDALKLCLEVVDLMEGNHRYLNINPKCEPQLGRRGLYNSNTSREDRMAMLWLLNLSDGNHSIIDVIKVSRLSPSSVMKAAALLLEQKLIVRFND